MIAQRSKVSRKDKKILRLKIKALSVLFPKVTALYGADITTCPTNQHNWLDCIRWSHGMVMLWYGHLLPNGQISHGVMTIKIKELMGVLSHA